MYTAFQSPILTSKVYKLVLVDDFSAVSTSYLPQFPFDPISYLEKWECESGYSESTL